MMTIQILFDIIYNKGESSKRKLVEYGGRPTFYLYSKFMNGGRIDDWLGSDDLLCDTDEQLRYSNREIIKG